jgi:hypothetical protein
MADQPSRRKRATRPAAAKARRKSAATPPRSSRPAKPSPEPEAQAQEAAERAFIASAIATGQAALPDAHGHLPAGATHSIECDAEPACEGDDDAEGPAKATPHIVRRRFSAY